MAVDINAYNENYVVKVKKKKNVRPITPKVQRARTIMSKEFKKDYNEYLKTLTADNFTKHGEPKRRILLQFIKQSEKYKHLADAGKSKGRMYKGHRFRNHETKGQNKKRTYHRKIRISEEKKITREITLRFPFNWKVGLRSGSTRTSVHDHILHSCMLLIGEGNLLYDYTRSPAVPIKSARRLTELLGSKNSTINHFLYYAIHGKFMRFIPNKERINYKGGRYQTLFSGIILNPEIISVGGDIKQEHIDLFSQEQESRFVGISLYTVPKAHEKLAHPHDLMRGVLLNDPVDYETYGTNNKPEAHFFPFIGDMVKLANKDRYLDKSKYSKKVVDNILTIDPDTNTLDFKTPEYMKLASAILDVNHPNFNGNTAKFFIKHLESQEKNIIAKRIRKQLQNKEPVPVIDFGAMLGKYKSELKRYKVLVKSKTDKRNNQFLIDKKNSMKSKDAEEARTPIFDLKYNLTDQEWRDRYERRKEKYLKKLEGDSSLFYKLFGKDGTEDQTA